ncbi:hypothetical protein [Novosphingobium pentaromativorans]|uniref:hypothetical protein n=1 Tax=Novosphingobium pentaromativorans TaxID=205844 RepID=UPI001939FA51|nr:hypothetical protein [Novosphingobium pentaromativorans]
MYWSLFEQGRCEVLIARVFAGPALPGKGNSDHTDAIATHFLKLGDELRWACTAAVTGV